MVFNSSKLRYCLIKFSLFFTLFYQSNIGFSQIDEGFNSKFLNILSQNFPKIETTLLVYTPQQTILKHDDFKVYEDETLITSFSIDLTRSHQYIALLLDRSSSMVPVIQQVKLSAINFVNTIVKSGNYKTGLVTFASDIDFTQDFTSDINLLENAIKSFKAYGGTALYDAIYKTCEYLVSNSKKEDHRILVVLTDGKDETPSGKPGFSIKKPKEVFEFINRSKVQVIAIGLGTNLDYDFLQSLARETNGVFLKCPTIDEVAKSFNKLSLKLSLQRKYFISYITPKSSRDGTKRTVKVISNYKGTKNQAIGYYIAPKDELQSNLTQIKASNKTKHKENIKIKEDLYLGRLQSPDLGSSAKLNPIQNSSLGSYTPISTLSSDIPEAQAGIEAANKAIIQVNKENEEIFNKNQEEYDKSINNTNKMLELLNNELETSHKKSQQQVDKDIQDVNTKFEEIEKNNKIEFNLPNISNYNDNTDSVDEDNSSDENDE